VEKEETYVNSAITSCAVISAHRVVSWVNGEVIDDDEGEPLSIYRVN
jgi:hypothetical protein